MQIALPLSNCRQSIRSLRQDSSKSERRTKLDWKKSNEITPSDLLLYSLQGAMPSHHQRLPPAVDSTGCGEQQTDLIQRESLNWRSPLGLSFRDQEAPWKRGRKPSRSQSGWRTRGKLDLLDKLSMAQMGSRRLKWPSKGLNGSVPLPQHMNYECQLGIFVRLLTVGASVSVTLLPHLEMCFLSMICLSQPQYERLCLV